MNQKLKISITILKEEANALHELTSASLVAYRNYSGSSNIDNFVILSSVYAFLIIKACSFQDELNTQFKKVNIFTEDAELNKHINFYNGLFENFDIRELRNLISHNRKKDGKEYKYITNEDIQRLKNMESHPEYNGFDVGASLIIKSINQLYYIENDEY